MNEISIDLHFFHSFDTFFTTQILSTTDVDECQRSDLNKCHEKAACSNNIGSYHCTCLDGYFGNGTHCQGMVIVQVLRF